MDLLLHADRRFVLGSLRDAVPRFIRRSRDENGTYSSYLLERLGPTVCNSFYFPYARKIWGRTPDELSADQAYRRVSAGSFPKLLRKVFGMIPGQKRGEANHFYYPRRGYGQISEAFSEAAAMDGATHLMGCKVTRLMRPCRGEDFWKVEVDQGSDRRTLEADHVWSTIPINVLARMMDPPPPSEVIEAANSLEYRAMLLIYLQLPVDQFTEYDAHYFPEAAISITRMSEPKNYVGSAHPHGRTTLCAELPCSPDEADWTKTEAELGALVADDLDRAGIPLSCKPDGIFVKRLRQAYPIYSLGYERQFSLLDDWSDQLPRLLSYGRQGLFAHDNTHHALAMAYAAADCLVDGVFDSERWHAYRSVFETHVVED
jgi:protoporphyrinogen oxidase